MKTFNFVRADCWCALYVDNKCVYQGHDMTVNDFVELLRESGVKINFSSECVDDETQEKVDEQGCFPDEYDALRGVW